MSDGETATDQSYVEQSKKTHKRRSSIFQVTRRAEVSELENEENEDRKKENEICNEEEPFDLRAYVESLRNERKAWKETLQARKTRRRNLQKEKSIVEKKGAKFDLGVLTESERSFVSSRPSYNDIAKNINRMMDEATKAAALILEIRTINDRLTVKLEEKIVDTTKKIIKMSCEET